MKYILKLIAPFILILFIFSSCEKDSDLLNYGQDMTPTGLNVELRKTSYPPFIIGEKIEFSFAAGSATEGKLKQLEVTASIAGAVGTKLDLKGRFFNWNTGMDDVYNVFKDTLNSGNITSGNYVDTIAATARYTYVIPATALGKKISLTFKVSTASKSVSQTVDYTISNIIMSKAVVIETAKVDGSGKAFFSIAEGKAYSRTEVEAGNLQKSIDFVYVVDPVGPAASWKLNSAIVAPANQYMPAGILGSSWTDKNASEIEIKNWEDFQLMGSGRLNMVSDVDFQQAQIVTKNMMAINLIANSRSLVKSADGKWIALVWVAAVDANSLTINMKKYQLK
jgi:hypothetical protein